MIGANADHGAMPPGTGKTQDDEVRQPRPSCCEGCSALRACSAAGPRQARILSAERNEPTGRVMGIELTQLLRGRKKSSSQGRGRLLGVENLEQRNLLASYNALMPAFGSLHQLLADYNNLPALQTALSTPRGLNTRMHAAIEGLPAGGHVIDGTPLTVTASLTG